MTEDEAREAITQALANVAPEIDLTSCDTTAPLTRELDLDSMDVLNLLGGIAAATGVEIPESDVRPDWSIDDLVAHLAGTT